MVLATAHPGPEPLNTADGSWNSRLLPGEESQR